MKVLLTGAGGFLGAAVARELTASGHEVSGIGLTGRGGWPAVDLTEPGAAARIVVDVSPEVVVHLAGEASVAAAEADPDRAFRANATTTWNLLEAVSKEAPGAFFVLGSSAAVYGRPDPAIAGRVPESAPVEPVSVYGASKAAAEMVAGGYAAVSKPAVVIVRTFNLIGPGQGRGVAADLMAAARERRDAREAVRNPGAVRDFTDVRDAARAFAELASTRTPGTFNLCSGSAVAISELAEAVNAVTGRGSGSPERAGHGAHEADGQDDILIGDPGRLREAIGWQAGIDLAESLGAMAAEDRH